MDAVHPDPAVDAALAWLARAQHDTGEIGSVASPLDAGDPVWVPDSLKFITALAVLALDGLADGRARRIVDRAVAFLWRERETMCQWRYWSSWNDQYDLTPPDADDTACCSLAVATRGHRTGRNVGLLLANRDDRGRFLTWIIPRGVAHGPRYWWAVREELRGPVRRRRRPELWATTEAEPGDVDGVVNANVLRYLGRRAPAPAVDWVASLVDRGREDDCDSWHRNRFTLYASLGDAHRRGVPGLERVGATVVERIAERVDDRGAVGPPLDTAFALSALQCFDGPGDVRARLAASLRERQAPDGSWERSVFFYGGPKEVFGWASEELTAACACQVLDREARS